MIRKCTQMVSYINKYGDIIPMIIVSDEGIKYSISKSVELKNKISKSNEKYFRCLVNNQTIYLFYDSKRWFIQGNSPHL